MRLGNLDIYLFFSIYAADGLGLSKLRFVVNDISGLKRRAVTYSEPFISYTRMKFPGILDPTELSLSCYRQGVNLLNIRGKKYITDHQDEI